MSVTPSSWAVCASCGEIVLQSGDPDVQGRYHAPTCPELPSPRVRVMSPRDDGATEFALGAGGGRGGPGEPGGIWLTGDEPDELDEPDEPDEPAEPDFEEHDFGEHEPGLHRRQRMPAGDMIRAAARRVRPAFSFSLTEPGDSARRAAVVVLIGLSVFGLVIYLVAGVGRPAAKATPQAAGSTPPGSAIAPAPGSSASTPAPSAKPTPTATPSATATTSGAGSSGGGGGSSPQPAVNCTTSAALGQCGPYTYPQITGISPGTGIEIGNNVWNADQVSGWSQTLYAASPGDWGVTANMPAGQMSAVSFPTVAGDYQDSSAATPLSSFGSIYSSFSETMNANSGTTAWATYLITIGSGSGTSVAYNVEIQNDLADPYTCDQEATATFGGSGGVPVQTWDLCNMGSGWLGWKLADGNNEQSGSVDVLSMVSWLANNGYLPSDAGIFTIQYGWQISSTGGQNENFQVNGFSISATQ